MEVHAFSQDVGGNDDAVEQTQASLAALKEMGDAFRQYFKNSGIALIGSKVSKKPMVMCAVSDDLTAKIKAGDIVRSVGEFMGGGGGGKPHIATAGGSDVKLLQDALDHGKNFIQSIFSDN